MWVVRPTTRGTAVRPLLHQHTNRWMEAYEKDSRFFCCHCDELYPHPDFCAAADVTARPSRCVYQVFDSRFILVETRVQTSPTGDVQRWGPYGHNHFNPNERRCDKKVVAYDIVPILYRDQVICPSCLEETPDPAAYKALQEAQNVDQPVKNLTSPFPHAIRVEREGGEVQFLRYSIQLR